MTLEAGHNLLHYRLLEKLGEGGMGVVWKAVDTTLDREVAIKVLPDLLTTEPERLARFEREAKLLASLSHPNIAAVYGLHQGQGRHFLAMELVRGEDLGQRARREPFSTPEALEIARQIAEALEAAHEQGIIHRDLKPANVMLTQDGKVKVLDFGLAKALEAEPASGSLSMSPTITRGTEMGVILGTAAYMSPEQARGRPADRRADIWSFGVVLFEMLSGRQGFRGDTVTDVLAQVLTSAPDWDALPGDTPATVRTLLRRCLEKDAGRRLQAIGEARIAIEDHQAHPEEEAEPGTQATGGGTARGLRLAFGATAIVALLALGWALTRPAGDPLPQRRYLLDVDVDTTQGDSKFAISPDGSRITFITDERLFVWELDELQPRELSGAGSPVNGTPFWSPDGSSIGFLRTGTLYRLPATDGPAQTICRLPGPSSIAAWGPDDTIVFPTTRGPLYRVSAWAAIPRCSSRSIRSGTSISTCPPSCPTAVWSTPCTAPRASIRSRPGATASARWCCDSRVRRATAHRC